MRDKDHEGFNRVEAAASCPFTESEYAPRPRHALRCTRIFIRSIEAPSRPRRASAEPARHRSRETGPPCSSAVRSAATMQPLNSTCGRVTAHPSASRTGTNSIAPGTECRTFDVLSGETSYRQCTSVSVSTRNRVDACAFPAMMLLAESNLRSTGSASHRPTRRFRHPAGLARRAEGRFRPRTSSPRPGGLLGRQQRPGASGDLRAVRRRQPPDLKTRLEAAGGRPDPPDAG